jgi:hypothetical protein
MARQPRPVRPGSGRPRAAMDRIFTTLPEIIFEYDARRSKSDNRAYLFISTLLEISNVGRRG